MTAPPPVLALVRDAFATVSAQLPRLMALGRGPFVIALLLGLFFGALDPRGGTPLTTLATGIAYAWFSFYVFRLVLLGPAKAELPRAPEDEVGAKAVFVRRSILGTFLGRALGLGLLAFLGIAAITLFVTYPLTVLPTALEDGQAGLEASGFAVVSNLILATALAAWPVGVPIARLAPVLAATAVDRDTSFGAAWRLSRGHGLRLATAWIVLASPFVFGYAALNLALGALSEALGGDGPGLVAGLGALVLVTAMAMTMTALLSVATSRVWAAMAGFKAALAGAWIVGDDGRRTEGSGGP